MPAGKVLLLIIFIITQDVFCEAQVTDIMAETKNTGYSFINSKTEFLKLTALISPDSLLRNAYLQTKFRPLGNKKIDFIGYDPAYYWYRFSLYNSDTSTQNLVVLLGGLGIREGEIWQEEGQGLVSAGKTGYRYSFNKRHYPYVRHGFALSIAPRTEHRYFIRLDESHAYKSVGFVLVKQSYMRLFEHHFYFMFGIITGILLLFFLVNLYLLYSIREKIHLWYALYIISMLFFLVKNEGLDAEFLGLDSITGYRSTYMAAVASLAIGFLVTVVQLFLTNLGPATLLYRLLRFFKWALFVQAIAQFIVFLIEPASSVEWLLFHLANKTGLLSILLIVIACTRSYLTGFKPALYILTGQSVFLIGAAMRSLFAAPEDYIFPPSLFETGLIAEVIIISFGLMYRYNAYKKEKDLLKEKLEWQQRNTTNQVLIMQETEQKRIAQDLHDELGGNLAAIKMTLQTFQLQGRQLQLVTSLIDKASENARNIAHNLMPPEFEETPLEDLLSSYYQRLNTENNIRINFNVSGNPRHFTKQDELMIYRIVLELTNNILKHAQAEEAVIQLIYYDNYLELMAEDNGRGFPDNNKAGIGIKNITARVNYLGGKINIDSGKNGTTVIIQLPYKTSYYG